MWNSLLSSGASARVLVALVDGQQELFRLVPSPLYDAALSERGPNNDPSAPVEGAPPVPDEFLFSLDSMDC